MVLISLERVALLPGGLLGGGGGVWLGVWGAGGLEARDAGVVCWMFVKEGPSCLGNVPWLWRVDGKGWHLSTSGLYGQKSRVAVACRSKKLGTVGPGGPFQR